MITFLCGKCGKRLQVADEVVGKKCRCPSCTFINVVPGDVQAFGDPYAYTDQPTAAPNQPPSAGDLFPSATSGTSASTGGIWGRLDSQADSTNQTSNPYSVAPPPSPPPTYGPAHAPQYSGGYLPEASPLGMILGVLSVCMPLFICFYGLSIPLGLILGIVAWLTSASERKKAAQGLIRVGLADLGYILGIIGTVINAILLVVVMAFVLLVISAAASGNLK